MNIKAAIIDFDGTLVDADITDELCEITGRREESERINQEFFEGKHSGVAGLIQRINFLSGVTLAQIEQKLEGNDFLMPGARELFEFFRANNIISIIASGNIVPVLEAYQKKLGADYIVGSQPQMDGEKIMYITEKDISGKNFKVAEAKKILDALHIGNTNVIAIGDSPADTHVFEFAARSIAINPKNGIEQYAEAVVYNNLHDAIEILQQWLHEFN